VADLGGGAARAAVAEDTVPPPLLAAERGGVATHADAAHVLSVSVTAGHGFPPCWLSVCNPRLRLRTPGTV
jgi:hypothetical protein